MKEKKLNIPVPVPPKKEETKVTEHKKDEHKKKLIEHKKEAPKKETGTIKIKINQKVGLAIISVVIIIALCFTVVKLLPDNQPDNGLNPVTGDVAAVINSEEISMAELDEQYSNLPEFYKSDVTKEMMLNQMITEMLLLQEAKNQGIVVTDEEVDEFINTALAANNMTIEQLEQEAMLQNITLDDIKESYKKQMTISMLLNKTLGINATSEDAEEKLSAYIEELTDNADIEILAQFGTEPIEPTANLEQISSCFEANNLSLTSVVFFYSSTCPHCAAMEPIVEELEDEGYSIYWALAGSEEGDIAYSCLSSVLSGFVPEFVCPANGKTLLGEQDKAALEQFAKECNI